MQEGVSKSGTIHAARHRCVQKVISQFCRLRHGGRRAAGITGAFPYIRLSTGVHGRCEACKGTTSPVAGHVPCLRLRKAYRNHVLVAFSSVNLISCIWLEAKPYGLWPFQVPIFGLLGGEAVPLIPHCLLSGSDTRASAGVCVSFGEYIGSKKTMDGYQLSYCFHQFHQLRMLFRMSDISLTPLLPGPSILFPSGDALLFPTPGRLATFPMRLQFR